MRWESCNEGLARHGRKERFTKLSSNPSFLQNVSFIALQMPQRDKLNFISNCWQNMEEILSINVVGWCAAGNGRMVEKLQSIVMAHLAVSCGTDRTLCEILLCQSVIVIKKTSNVFFGKFLFPDRLPFPSPLPLQFMMIEFLFLLFIRQIPNVTFSTENK